MKCCVLCSSPARMYCSSDDATLCWDCDEKVHSANFLVAKHSRTLLCHICQSPTPWQASGPKLGLSLSLCQVCIHNASKHHKVEHEIVEEQSQESNQYEANNEEEDQDQEDDVEEDEYTDTDGEGEEEDDDEDEEEGDIQVVPWSSFPSPPNLSSEEASSSRSGGVKRTRDNSYIEFDSQENIDRYPLSSQNVRSGSEGDEATSYSYTSNKPRVREIQESRTLSIVNTLNRFHRSLVPGDQNQSAIGTEICKFSRDA